MWRNIAEMELVTAWNKASNIPFYAFDKRGQEIKYTIYRYMTSMGLRKDANSLSQLQRADVIRIENGETTYLKYNLFEKRLRSLIFEFQQYKQTKNPNNQTLIQIRSSRVPKEGSELVFLLEGKRFLATVKGRKENFFILQCFN